MTAGTIFQGPRQPLTLWLRAIWWVTAQKNGASALGLQRIMGLGQYRTAWTWLHKLRRAMVRPQRDRLSGCVKVDEIYVGGQEKGAPGRSRGKKSLVAVAAEEDGEDGIRRIRLRRVPDASAASLEAFILDTVEPGSRVRTLGWPSYSKLHALGYRHRKRECELRASGRYGRYLRVGRGGRLAIDRGGVGGRIISVGTRGFLPDCFVAEMTED